MTLSDQAPLRVELDDATPLRLRPIVAADHDRIMKAFEQLSPEGRLNRFWEKRTQLPEKKIKNLSQTDGWNHFAWIALHAEDDEFPGYGGASCWRDFDNPERAEISFTVADKVQRRGIGTLLLSVLWFEAWQLGVKELYGIARRENQALIDWFSSLGADMAVGSRHVEVMVKLTSPSECVERLKYGLEFESHRVILADWMQDWLEITQ